jgi:hypothetical protein
MSCTAYTLWALVANRCSRNQFVRTAFMERSHRPPFTTAPVADSQRFSDPLLFTLALARIAKGDGCLPQRKSSNDDDL